MPQLEAHEKVLLDPLFVDDPHGAMACTLCHAGVALAATRAEAHVGLVPYPSSPQGELCAGCHPEAVATAFWAVSTATTSSPRWVSTRLAS